MKQEWCCEGCGKHGSVAIQRHADLMNGYYTVIEGHAKASPVCRDPSLVRVRVAALCTPAQWRKIQLDAIRRAFIVDATG